jgi:two-component system response regulator (stage 0 sporulation protein A)
VNADSRAPLRRRPVNDFIVFFQRVQYNEMKGGVQMANVVKRVLLVDDNRDFSFLFETYLELLAKGSLELIGTAGDGLEALRCIELEQPDIVVLDILLPELNGIGVLGKIQTLKIEKKPKIFMLSGVSRSHTIQEALDLGADGYIVNRLNKIPISKLIQL